MLVFSLPLFIKSTLTIITSDFLPEILSDLSISTVRFSQFISATEKGIIEIPRMASITKRICFVP
jgi:hypothetical protein